MTVITAKTDKYGREVGNIFVDRRDINLEQIKAGYAWHYKKYQHEQKESDRTAYPAAETAAKTARVGLWQDASPIAPWDYRTELKAKQEENRENRKYYRGAKGGCYYFNSAGNKTYLKDKSLCEDAAEEPRSENKNYLLEKRCGRREQYQQARRKSVRV